MRKRTLGRTGLLVSELSLGTWGLSGDAYGPVSERDQDAVIDRALTFGINLFDTADCYARGAMELKLGSRLPSDGSVFIVTKIGTDLNGKPARKRFDVEFLEASLKACQERLRRPLDIVLLHNPSADAVGARVAGEWMQQQVEQGTVKAWGISAGNKDVIYRALAEDPKPSIVELAYNAFMTSDMNDVQYELEQGECGVLARSVLAHGLLPGYWAPDKSFPPSDHRHERWTPDQLKRRIHQLQAFRALQSYRVPTQRAAALRYVLDNKRVSSAVLGPRSTMQLNQLVREAGSGPVYLDTADKGRFDSRLYELGVHR